MAQTVNEAFRIFLADTVNLDKDQTDKGRSSRDWLYTQIAAFQNDATFPRSFPENDINYGSFARRTKTRPLNDIDLMICLTGQGAFYTEYSDRIEITANPQTTLKSLCDDYTNTLNSIKVVNKFVSKCADVPQYSKADIKRNGSAAVLSLQSYDWAFDIVPCFISAPIWDGRTFYFIPDGNGNWKPTDPRIDRDRTKNINQAHDGNVLNVIRIIKYWQKRPTMPSMSSYLLETMILDYYAAQSNKASQFVDMELPSILEYISTNIYYRVNDPKNIQGDINTLSSDDQIKISVRAGLDKQKANEARNLETHGDHKGSINRWREIFGEEFPKYE